MRHRLAALLSDVSRGREPMWVDMLAFAALLAAAYTLLFIVLPALFPGVLA